MKLHHLTASSSTLTLWEPAPETLYTIDCAAQFSGLPRRHIALYARYGLIQPAGGRGEGGWYFTAETIRTLRCIEDLRVRHRFDMAGARFVLGLMKEIERLRAEMAYPHDY